MQRTDIPCYKITPLPLPQADMMANFMKLKATVSYRPALGAYGLRYSSRFCGASSTTLQALRCALCLLCIANAVLHSPDRCLHVAILGVVPAVAQRAMINS